jgi:hypothetical protein
MLCFLAKAFSETKHVIDNKGLYNLDLDGDFQNLFNIIKLMLLKEPIFAIIIILKVLTMVMIN